MTEAKLSASDVASTLHGLRDVRAGPELRAAGLSLMVWALVLTSMTGSLLANGLVQFRVAEANGGDFLPGGWELFMASLLAMVVFWVAVGIVMQGLVFRSFSVRESGHAIWKRALVAAGVVVASTVFFGFTQGLTRAIQGIGSTPEFYDALHHNLGTAAALGVAGTVFLAMVVAQGDWGVPRWRGVALAVTAMLAGHATTFLWFPDIGVAGVIAAAALLPLGLITFGLHLWRRG